MRNKKSRPEVDGSVNEKRSHITMLGKVVGGIIGSTIAEQSGRSGLLGGAAGVVLSRIVRRSPMGALMIGGAWVGHKLYRRNQERKFDAAARAAKPVRVADPATPPPVRGEDEG